MADPTSEHTPSRRAATGPRVGARGVCAVVAHVTTAHGAADVRIFEKECCSLAEAGYTVWLLAPKADERIARGVHIRPVSMSAGRGTVGRYLARLYGAYRAAASVDARIFHLHDPELIPVGLLLKARGAKVIYDAHEDESVEALSLNRARPLKGRILSSLWRIYIALAAALFDGLVAATPAIAIKLPQRKTALVRNFPRLERFCVPDADSGKDRPNEIIYVGGISEIRGLHEMLDALDRIPERLGCRLKLLGPFWPEELLARAQVHRAWAKVDYMGQVPWETVIREIGRVRVGLVLLHPTPEYLLSLPVKLFEYMAAGLPVVASDFPEWRAIIESAQCGILVDPLDALSIAGAIIKLLDDRENAARMGNNGRRAVVEKYDWGAEARELIQLYDRIAIRVDSS